MLEKSEVETLKGKLFNKKENGWNFAEDKNDIFNYAKGYIEFMNKAKTEREIIKESENIAKSKALEKYMSIVI